MYDHEYEWQILGFLRMLKYVWQRNPNILAEIGQSYRCDAVCLDDLFEMSVFLLAEYICVDFVEDDDPDNVYGGEFAGYLLLEPELDEYLALHTQLEKLRFGTCRSTGANKLRDAVEMYVGSALYDFKITQSNGNCTIHLWPSPDWYDPIEVANSVIDLMTYLEAEIARMKTELADLTAPILEMELAA